MLVNVRLEHQRRQRTAGGELRDGAAAERASVAR